MFTRPALSATSTPTPPQHPRWDVLAPTVAKSAITMRLSSNDETTRSLAILVVLLAARRSGGWHLRCRGRRR
jgi:hypothetical protein